MPPKRSRSKSRPKIRKKQVNHYDLIQFKKMLGKNLVKIKSALPPAKIADYKKYILDGSIHEIKISGILHDGILVTEDDLAAVIQNLTYNEITKNNIDITVQVSQA